MLDYRVETFLVLCETGSYTKTAGLLNMTQPAVTQHIQYLERRYGVNLVQYTARELRLTEAGVELRRLALAMKANDQKITSAMLNGSFHQRKINFGATLTIGEYVLPKRLMEYIRAFPEQGISMLVDNTQNLLKRLEEGGIDFAVVEGYFDKDKYGYQLLKRAEFIGTCAFEEWKNQSVTIEELKKYRIITRENGSGTRDILETILHEKNMNLNNFAAHIEMGNFNAIKELVKQQLGVTFLYQEVVENELLEGSLYRFKLEDVKVIREFNIVYLKEDVLLNRYEDFWNFMIN